MNQSNLPNPQNDNNYRKLIVSNDNADSYLLKILKELKKINLYNAMAHNQELKNEDIS